MRPRDTQRIIAGLAEHQHGVVTRAQLLAAGVSPWAVDRRVQRGDLRLVHRGVYRVGPIATAETRMLAAVLACGPGAALSGADAAALWRLLSVPTPDRPVEVTVAGRRTGRLAGIRVHHVRALPRSDVTIRRAIPVTSVPRTLCDLAASAAARDLEQAYAEALVLRLTSPDALAKYIKAAGSRPGLPRLRTLLGRGNRVAYTRSQAEARLLKLVRKVGLTEPETNTRVAGLKVDFVWRAERLCVEVDGEAFHGIAPRFESDRRRDALLLAAGFRAMRVTWRQLVDEPTAVLVRLAQALARSA